MTQAFLMLNEADFYSHAREGRDATDAGDSASAANFYSHAREGRDVNTFWKKYVSYKFLLTRPRGA